PWAVGAWRHHCRSDARYQQYRGASAGSEVVAFPCSSRRLFRGQYAGAAGLKVVAQERPLWFLPASYLSERIAAYLPWVSKLRNAAPFVGLQPRTVRLNLHDSLLLYLREDK